jgi:hypothetical protein
MPDASDKSTAQALLGAGFIEKSTSRWLLSHHSFRKTYFLFVLSPIVPNVNVLAMRSGASHLGRHDTHDTIIININIMFSRQCLTHPGAGGAGVSTTKFSLLAIRCSARSKTTAMKRSHVILQDAYVCETRYHAHDECAELSALKGCPCPPRH